jgi:RNA polymerase sigma-70 factor (ECF subfamily)
MADVEIHVNAGIDPIAQSSVEPFDFEATFVAQYSRLLRVIVRIVNDPARAEDLAMEVFWKLWRKPPRDTSDAGAWLYRVAVRTALDELRKQSRRQKYERLFETMRRRANVSSEPVNEDSEQVRLVLASIKRRDAEILLLRSEGMTYEDLAKTFCLNSSSVGTLLRRAQLAFRKEYIKRYGER